LATGSAESQLKRSRPTSSPLSPMFPGCRSPGCVTGWLTGTSIPHTPSWQLPWRATFPSLNVQSAPSLTKRKVDSRVGSLNIVLKPDLHRRRVVGPGSGPLQRTAVLGVCLCLVRDPLEDTAHGATYSRPDPPTAEAERAVGAVKAHQFPAPARRRAHPDGPAQREASQSFRAAARQLTPVAQCSLGEPMPVSGLLVLDS